MDYKILLATLGLIFSTAVRAERGKVIEFGWDVPTIQWLHDNTAAAELVPFDGVAVDLGRISGYNLGFSQYGWYGGNLPSSVKSRITTDVNYLNTTNFTRLRENLFFQVYSSCSYSTGTPDWFDSGFDYVVSNMGYLADRMYQSNVTKILFDAECYSNIPVWQYSLSKYKTTKTFAEYQAQVRLRAQQIAQTLKAKNPGRVITILFTMANSEAWRSGIALPENVYGLLPMFLDGLLDEAGDQIRLVEGHEDAYYSYTDSQFQYSIMYHNGGATLSTDPTRYLTKVGMGFGTWLDANNTWYEDPNLNYFTPAKFRQSLDWTTRHGVYTWVYNQMPNWWQTSPTVPLTYRQVLHEITGVPAINVSGVVNLGGYLGDKSEVAVTVEFLQSGVSKFKKSLILNSSGQFSVYDGSLYGVYDITVKGCQWLAASFPNVTVLAPVNLGAIHLTGGNLDGSGGITAADLAVVLRNLE